MAALTRLQERVEVLIPQIEVLLCNQGLDDHQVRAFEYLRGRLAEIRDEAENGVLTRTLDRKGEMARVVTESDPNVLNPTLGGALIEVECEYYSLAVHAR